MLVKSKGKVKRRNTEPNINFEGGATAAAAASREDLPS